MSFLDISIYSWRVEIEINDGLQTQNDPDPEVCKFAFKKLVSSLDKNQLGYLQEAINNYGVE